MSRYTLTKTRFHDGVWEGLVVADAPDAPLPEIEARLHDAPLRGLTLAPAGQPGRWVLELPIPVEALGDGVQTFVMRDAATDTVLQDFVILAGDALGDDIRAELALLRAELDMLKRAFRRHCAEG